MKFRTEEILAKGRILVPASDSPTRQSFHMFGMYRSGSSVLEIVSQALAKAAGLTPFNVAQAIDQAGLSIIDPRDYSRSQIYIDAVGSSLDNLCAHGGYIYYGFREIPIEYGKRFVFLQASTLLVRDPRDILISQFRSVNHHTTDGASGENIKILRKVVSQKSLEEFVLSRQSIQFAKRICDCYERMISRGVKVLNFEEFFGSPKKPGIHGICNRLIDSFPSYLPISVSRDQIRAHIDSLISNSKSLKGHSTGGRIGLYRELSEVTQKKLTVRLEKQLFMLGYQ